MLASKNPGCTVELWNSPTVLGADVVESNRTAGRWIRAR